MQIVFRSSGNFLTAPWENHMSIVCSLFRVDSKLCAMPRRPQVPAYQNCRSTWRRLRPELISKLDRPQSLKNTDRRNHLKPDRTKSHEITSNLTGRRRNHFELDRLKSSQTRAEETRIKMDRAISLRTQTCRLNSPKMWKGEITSNLIGRHGTPWAHPLGMHGS